jgi:hypothetical protein
VRRDETRQLDALAVDRVEQARVCDHHRRLVGKGLDQFDLLVPKRTGDIATDGKRPDQLTLHHDRDAEQRSKSHDHLPPVVVVSVFEYVFYLDYLTRQRHPANNRRPVA